MDTSLPYPIIVNLNEAETVNLAHVASSKYGEAAPSAMPFEVAKEKGLLKPCLELVMASGKTHYLFGPKALRVHRHLQAIGQIVERWLPAIEPVADPDAPLCPHCNARMQFQEGGKALKCPSCGHVMVSIG